MATETPQMQTIHKTEQIHKTQQKIVKTITAMRIILQKETAIVMQTTQPREIVREIHHLMYLMQQKKETAQKIQTRIQQKIAQAMLLIENKNGLYDIAENAVMQSSGEC